MIYKSVQIPEFTGTPDEKLAAFDDWMAKQPGRPHILVPADVLAVAPFVVFEIQESAAKKLFGG